MIYIDNNTTGFTIPRITNGIGDKVILINQITKRRFELSTDVLNDVGYKVDITDLKLEIGQYDYVVKKNNIPLESGILQVGGYKSQNNQYEVDFNIIQYEPNIVYTPLPEKVLNVTENGIYNVESFDKVDVDVKDKESVIIIEQLENQIDTLEDEISTLEGTVSGLETEVNRLDDLKDNLQSQIDSVTTLSVTENGTYIPEEGTLGWNEVNVQLEKPVFKIKDGTSLRTNETEIPFDIDSTGVTNFNYMFYSCSKLTTIPQLDTSKGTNFGWIFSSCSNLTTIPQLDTSKGTNFSFMFGSCSNLTTVPQLDTSKGTNFSYMFSYCNNLTTVPQLDTSKGTNFNGMFSGCKALKNVQFTGSINYSITFEFSYDVTNVLNPNAVSYTTIGSILRACANTTNTNAKTLTLGSPAPQYPNLTYEGKTIREWVAECNSKGWTIIGMPTILG